jgi:hypothetical protein
MPDNVEPSEARSNRGFLITAYVLAVLLPIVGILLALYTAVAQRRVAIRRHAIGIAGVAIVSGVVFAVVISAVNKTNQNANVASDLRSLLDRNSVPYSKVNVCVHQAGTQYVCMVTRKGQQIPVQVTDDGQNIYEQGISASYP